MLFEGIVRFRKVFCNLKFWNGGGIIIWIFIDVEWLFKRCVKILLVFFLCNCIIWFWLVVNKVNVVVVVFWLGMFFFLSNCSNGFVFFFLMIIFIFCLLFLVKLFRYFVFLIFFLSVFMCMMDICFYIWVNMGLLDVMGGNFFNLECLLLVDDMFIIYLIFLIELFN